MVQVTSREYILFKVDFKVYYLGRAAGTDGRTPGADAAGNVILSVSLL